MDTDAIVVSLEAKARAATNINELAFSIANDSHGLLPFRQAFIFTTDAKPKLQVISGMAKLTENSPYILWLRDFLVELKQNLKDPATWYTQKDIKSPERFSQGWQEWWAAGVYCVALKRRSGEIMAWVCFLLDQPPSKELHGSVMHLAQTWSYCWEMTIGKPRRSLFGSDKKSARFSKKLLFILIIAAFFIPIRQSVLAPAEVIALDATIIASPMEGVIHEILVRPNQAVQKDQPLFNLDDTVLRNRLAVLTQQVAVADAELATHTQRSFNDHSSKSELALAAGRAKEKRAELNAVQDQLSKVIVSAPHNGIAVYADSDDWLGKPISTGERIMQLANPESAGILIQVPVADALVLDEGSEVKLFLTVRPLDPIDATVTESSYQATLSDEGIASYKLRASLNNPANDIRIGLRGTAKIYGNRTILIYYLMRRPFAKLRELTGL